MSFDFSKMNNRKKATMCPGINSRELGDIRNLKDFCGCVIYVEGFFFSHSSKYDNDQVVIAGTVYDKDKSSGQWNCLGTYLMNTPGRTYQEFSDMADDPEALASILRGELVISGIQMCETKSGSTVIYSYRNCKPRYEESDGDEFVQVSDDEELPFD